MKRISLVLCLALMLVALFAVTAFAATYKDITDDARFEQNGSTSDLLDIEKVRDGNYNTASSCGNAGENWVNYRFYYDEGTTVSKVFVVLNSTGTLSNGTVFDTVSENSYEFYIRLYDKYENVVIGTKYHSINNAIQAKDEEGNVLYTYFEVVFEEPYTDIYMVEVPVVNNKNADVGLWEVEIYNYVCGEDEHEWVGTLCGEHCDVCGELRNPSLACEAEEDDGDCRTAVLCKYCDSVIVASQKHVFAEGETVCSNPGCVFEGKNIAKDTTITPADVSENTYGENGEFLNWWYYSAHITDGKYNTIAHSNYFGQYKFTFNIKNPTKLSEIFIVSNSSGVYHPWGYGYDNLSKDLKVKVIIYDVDGNAIQTVEYNSLDFTNPNVVPIYSESGEMTSVAYKLDANYANAKKVELYINEGVWEVEIYEHVTCDYQFVEVVDPTCTEEGYDLYKCACGNEKHENAVDALGHNYDDGVVTKEPGEEEDGIIVYTCQTCGNEKSLAIPATGHEHNYDSYVGISIEPTCAVVGSATYQCKCGDLTEIEIPATGNHNYTEFVAYTKEPTYLADGFADYKCATCDATINVNVGRLQMNTAKYAQVVKELGGWTVCEKYLIDGNYNLGSAGSHTTNGWAFSLNYGEDYTFTKLAFVVNSVGKFPSDGIFNYTSKTNKSYSFAITLYDADGKAVWSKSTTCADAVEMTGTDAEGNQFLYDIVTIELDEAVVASKLYVKINSGWDNGAGMWEVETYGLPVNYHEDHIYSVELERYSDPTCTEDGFALYRCAKCETTSVESIPALGHQYTYACDKVCVVCNEERDATHTMVHVDAKASDCTNNGNVEYWYCSDCGYAWLDEACTQVTNQMSVVVPATGHDWNDADCENAKTCSVCGETEGDALGHSWDDADCENAKTCSVCGATEGEALGHTWTNATCTAPKTCSVCGATEGEALGHTWTDATCTTPKTCSVCSATEGEALGHSYFSPCDKVCEVCGEVTNPDATHNIVHVEAKAGTDCKTWDGNIEYWYCSVCGAAWTDEALTEVTNIRNVIANGEHSYFSPCDKVCMVCNEVTNPDATHNIVHVEAKAGTDCKTWDGNIEYWYCSVCGAAWTDEALTEVTNIMSVNVNGEHSYYYPCDKACMVCHEVTNPDATHNIIYVAAKAGTNCQTWDGNIEYWYCFNCGNAWTDEALTQVTNSMSIKANGAHNYVAGEPAVDGSVTYTCDNCGDSYTESVEHTHTEVEIPAILPLPSNDHTGMTAGVQCSECGEVLVAPVEKVAGTSSDKNFKVNSAAMSFGEEITFIYNATHPANSDKDSMYMVFVFNGEEFYSVRGDVVSGNRYRFDFVGQKAHLLAENIEAYVYAIEDGEYVMNSHLQYSGKQYCVNQLKKSSDENFKALLCSVLNLCATTQLSVNPNTPVEELVTTMVENELGIDIPEVNVESIDSSYNVQGMSGDRTQGYDWKSGALALGGSVELKLQFVAEEVEGLVLHFDINGERTIEIDASDLTLGNDGRYSVYFQVKVLEYDKPITCTFIKDGEQVGSTLTYSVYSYIVRQYANANAAESTKNFVKAIYAYSEALKVAVFK